MKKKFIFFWKHDIWLTVIICVCASCIVNLPFVTTDRPQFTASTMSADTTSYTVLAPLPSAQIPASPRKIFTKTPASSPTVIRTLGHLPSAYVALPPGQYVLSVESDANSKKDVLEAISVDGKIQTKLPISVVKDVGSNIRLSPNGQRMFYERSGIGYLFDLQRNSPIAHFSVARLKDCLYDVFLDKGYVISVCEDDFVVEFPLEDRPAIHLPVGGLYPRWSPDGKWIAYFVFKSIADPHPGQIELGPEDGLYLMDTICLDSPSTCIDKTRGPYPIPPQALSWSADARYLSVGRSIFDVEQGEWQDGLELNNLGNIGDFVWSPDNKQLAVSATGRANDFSEAGIYIVSLDDGTATKIPNCECMGYALAWITVP